MKPYLKPTLVVFEIEVTEVVAGSGGFIGINPNPSTDFAPEVRRSNGWDEYEQ